jgi:hypothetical protein
MNTMTAPVLVDKSFDLDSLAKAYGAAKSRQNIADALACCSDDFVLETPAFGTRSVGAGDTARDLRRFFALFPDYRFFVEGSAVNGTSAVLWGRAEMTFSGRVDAAAPFGARLLRAVRLTPTRVVLPAVAVFESRAGKLTQETFYFDGIDLARQLRVPAWLLGLAARSERARRADTLAVPVEERAFVRQPIERVFERAFLDVTQMMRANPPRPLPRARRIELVGAKPEVGAIRRVHLTTGHAVDEVIIALEAPTRFAYRIANGWGDPFDRWVASTQGEHLLSARDGGTEIVWRGVMTATSPAALPLVKALRAGLVAPFFRRFLRSIERDFPADAAQGARVLN